MLIIPVLDISHGLVVHAVKGEREHYKKISSVIASSPNPTDVINAFLKLYPFKIIYIADLDAIQGNENQGSLIEKLAQQFQQCEFWVDAGIDIFNNKPLYQKINIRAVIGSENKLDKDNLNHLFQTNPGTILSLDFNQNGLIENQYLLDNTSLWPKKVIAMMLHQVGSQKGVDETCITRVINLCDEHEIYAAGGISNFQDIEQLRNMKLKGVLISTAIHNGSINRTNLKQLME